ncbi:hypothetical protein [Helicobacter sp. L8]|uniref:hypothetical protein n=1 Tax=Helicobacter sp. L8 TaxID=2316078 RepID=UPI000EAB58A5|nr:hypothetical protein [Helicobacter sp. L8]
MGGSGFNILAYSIKELRKCIAKLQEQAGKTQTAEKQLKTQEQEHAQAIKDKNDTIATLTKEKESTKKEAKETGEISANLENAINALYSALLDLKEQDSSLTPQDKLEAIKAKVKTAPAPIVDKPTDNHALKELQVKNKSLQEQNRAKDKTIADLQEQNARLLQTTQEQALQTLLGEVYLLTQKLDPDNAEYLKGCADQLLEDVARLREWQKLAPTLQEQAHEDKRGGDYHK